MTQRSMFFDSSSGTTDRSYDSSYLASLLSALVHQDGVVYGYRQALAVSAPGGMAVSVGTGAAFVQGRMFEVYGSAETLTIAAADPTYPRIDRVVVRMDTSQAVRSVTLAVKTGVAQTSPVAPALQRDTTVWELSLAQVYVAAGATAITAGNITDERENGSVCGYVSRATLDANGKVAQRLAYEGAASGVATLDANGKVAQNGVYSSGVSSFTPADVKAALDALAGVRIVGMAANANGTYVKWENGLQIASAWGFVTGTGSNYSIGVTSYFAAPFTSVFFLQANITGVRTDRDPTGPMDIAGQDTDGHVNGNFYTNDRMIFRFRMIDGTTIPSGTRYVLSGLAIGTWK